MIAPIFEELAGEKTKNGDSVAFTKIDLDVGMGSAVAREWGVSVTPTFVFFLDGKKVCVRGPGYHYVLLTDALF